MNVLRELPQGQDKMDNLNVKCVNQFFVSNVQNLFKLVLNAFTHIDCHHKISVSSAKRLIL